MQQRRGFLRSALPCRARAVRRRKRAHRHGCYGEPSGEIQWHESIIFDAPQRILFARVHAILSRHCRGAALGFMAFNQTVNQFVGVHALGLSLKVENDAMPQRRPRHKFDIFVGDVEAALQQRAHFARQNQRLRAARLGLAAVVNAQRKLTGIVTSEELIKRLVSAAPATATSTS